MKEKCSPSKNTPRRRQKSPHQVTWSDYLSEEESDEERDRQHKLAFDIPGPTYDKINRRNQERRERSKNDRSHSPREHRGEVNNEGDRDRLLDIIESMSHQAQQKREPERRNNHGIKVPDPPSYNGDGTMLSEFETKFRRYVTYRRFEEEKAAELMSFYLKDQAADFHLSLSNEDKKNMDRLFKKLRDRFCSESFKILKQQEHIDDKMKEGENVDQYIQRFQKRIRVLGLDPDGQVHQFVAGLTDNIREHCMLSTLGSLTAAHDIAIIIYQAMNWNKRQPE